MILVEDDILKLDIVLAVDRLAPEMCDSFNVLSNAETFYSRPQNVHGCAVSDEPSTATSKSVVSFIVFAVSIVLLSFWPLFL